MRFNCHAHIFNFQSVLTEQTVQTLLNRLGREKWPPFVVDAVTKTVMRVIHGGNLDDDEIARALITEFSVSDKFAEYLQSLNAAIPADVQIVADGNIEGLAADAIAEQLRKIGDLIDDNNDAKNQTLSDLVAFIAMALKPSIAAVADTLFELSGPNTAVVGLMLDITKGETADEPLFMQQLEDTSRAALAYPGRLLPFVSVNTLRASHFDRMEFALEHKGFVGVKLYPSLGYTMTSDGMERVFAYCETNEVPVLLHCNRGGFFFNVSDIEYCDPSGWDDILTRHPSLRVCFGHFGGDENLVQPAIPDGSWTAKIVSLMRKYPAVYADISFHTAPMAGGEAEKNYFEHIRRLLDDDQTRDRVLFGSDYFLVRQRLRQDNLWRYFDTHFEADEFDQITVANPPAYLGIADGDGANGRANIKQHVYWLAAHRTDVQRLPADWVVAAIGRYFGSTVQFAPSALGPAWSVNNQAHNATWQYFRTAQMFPFQQVKPFNQAGTILLRQLMYWNEEHAAPSIFSDKCNGIALSFDDAMRKAGVSYEDGGGIGAARVALAAALAEGDTALYVFAATVDRLYRFPVEGAS